VGERAIKEICEEVLGKVTPSEKERGDVLHFSRGLTEELNEKMRISGIEANAQVQGSVAKDTWLAGERDIDIFILLPKAYTKEAFPKVLDVVKALAEEKWVEAYAEHPYVEAEVEGYKVDFVPCFRVERAEEAGSSVDRTPLHTAYIKRCLDQRARDEVRLLKRFMKGIGVYGAEIRVGGFSGYLCELLVLHHGSFLNVLRPFAEWKERKVIDYEGHYEGKEREAKKIFEEPLIVVDPVDRGRNVASAVREERFYEFVAASRAFISHPSLTFFYPPETKPFEAEQLVDTVKARGSTLIFLKVGEVKAVPDILWGQLYKTQRSLHKVIQRHDFRILRDRAWTDERSFSLFLFELEQRFLPPMRRHLGPPLEKRTECERFLQKHINSPETVSGPRIEGNRWVVETRRKHTDVVGLLMEKLKDGGRDAGVAELISRVIPKSLEVCVNEEIVELYSANHEFARFLTEYLKERPKWLE